MSLLNRLRSFLRPDPGQALERPGTAPRKRAKGGSLEEESALDAGERAPSVSVLPQIQRLVRVGLPNGPSVEEAIALLRQVRGTVHEAEAVVHALRELDQRP